ncbi:MAG TPA: hypothetical protein VMY37_00815 [Thermoguttaceae bacterium]|nr:hypothetical protein [Thermoguttaceae bacterium]
MTHVRFPWLRVLGLLLLITAACPSARAADAVKADPAPIVRVRGELAQLSPDKPQAWARGTRLREIQTLAPGIGTPAPGAIVPESIVVRHGERVLIRGRDYLVDPYGDRWGSAPSRASPRTTESRSITTTRCGGSIPESRRPTAVRSSAPASPT